MKKILLLSFYYTPDLCAGSFRAAALIDALLPMAKSYNIHIDLITTMPNRYHHFKAEAGTYEQRENIAIYRIPLPSHKSGFIDQAKAFTTYYLSVKKLLKKNKAMKYDCVFSTSSRLFTAFLGARVSHKYQCPLFLDMRDIFTETMESLLPAPLKKILVPIFKQVENYTLKRANALNLVSSGFTSYFSQKIKSDCALFHISNGVDICFKNLNNKTIAAHFKKPIRILYAGNIGAGQGIEKIIPSLAHNTADLCEFRIVGSGGKLNTLKKTCANITNVKIIPPMSRALLITEYEQADILFLHLNDCPAFLRVLPSKIFEYVMTGKPILAGVPGCSAKFLSEHVLSCEVFKPCDADAGLEKLKMIIDNNNTDNKTDTELFYQKFNREKLIILNQ